MGLKKQIIQFKDGEQIAVYDSTRDAAKVLNVSENRIYKLINGKTKKLIDGCSFQYSGEYTNHHENNGEIKCPYCDKRFENYNGLTKHIFSYKAHGEDITREQLLADFKYDGIRPTCKCGCGEFTDISYQGGAHFVDYVHGHHARVHNNWGHNEKAKEHSAETRREQYRSGQRVQWNKGKSWKETFSPKKIKELMKVYDDKERNDKIRNALKGVKKSEEHKRNLKKAFNTQEYKEIHREQMARRLSDGTFSLSSMVEKRFIDECIKPFGIEYDTQYYLKDICHYCDVYIPSKNTIVEFQGDYWHGNPKKYKKEELTEYQLEKVKKDEILRKYCKDNGFRLIEVWESDFNKDKESINNLLVEMTRS